jgi:diguanylate cyclase (GGDEF)-like protein
MNDSLFAWRTREGTALLVFYGALIVVVSAAFDYADAASHAFPGAPLWVRLLPVAVPSLLVCCVLLVRALRPAAYRLQLLNVGCFLVVAVALFAPHKAGGSMLAIVMCMFAVQYAFMRWQELVAAYAAALLFFVLQASPSGAAIPAAVAVVCIALGSLRLRSMYAAAAERYALERQTAQLRRQMERNARMAFTDSLTGLLNRAGMNDLIDRALLLSKRNDSRTALLYMDLDSFKQINDVCGHDAGDLALVEAALRIQYLLRSGETAGRIGGDEFLIVLPSVQTIEEARMLAKRVDEAFSEPFEACGTAFSLAASIGIAISGEDGHNRVDLISAADKAMYELKRRRKRQKVVRITGARGA